MGWLAKLRGEPRDEQLALYQAVVARGREPHWYLAGGVPDTNEGRFDMIATVLAAVLLRFEDAPEGAPAAARLAERFVDDMDGQLREEGVGDLVVGKHVGRMMALLGGRLGALRDGWAAGDVGPALVRNLYRGAVPTPEALAHVADALGAMREGLRATPITALSEGALP